MVSIPVSVLHLYKRWSILNIVNRMCMCTVRVCVCVCVCACVLLAMFASENVNKLSLFVTKLICVVLQCALWYRGLA